MLVSGNYIDSYESENTAVVGQGVAFYLSLSIGNVFDQLQVYVPDREKTTYLRRRIFYSTFHFASWCV